MSPVAQRSKKSEILSQEAADPNLLRVEALQEILINQQQRQVSYEEAREIGDSLIEFYQVLAEEVNDESSS